MTTYVDLDGCIEAWETFVSLDVRQIQTDLCSYLILPRLVSAGLYREVIKRAMNVIALYSKSVVDVGNFIGKSFENMLVKNQREITEW